MNSFRNWILAVCVAIAGIALWQYFKSTAPVTSRMVNPTPAQAIAKVEATPTPAPVHSDSAPATVDESNLSREELLARLRAKMAAGGSTEDLLAILGPVTKTRPALALELAQTIARGGGEKFDLVVGVVHHWAGNDPQAAWKWSLHAPQGTNLPGANVVADEVMQQMAQSNPDLLTATVAAALQPGGWPASLKNEFDVNQMVNSAVDSLIKAGHADLARSAIEEWTASGTSIGANPLASVATFIAKTSPTDAAAWLNSLPASEDRDAAYGSLAEAWAGRDAPAAMKWAEDLDEGSRGLAMQNVFSQWLENSAPTAMEWLNTRLQDRTANPVMDRLISKAVRDTGMANSNPKLALEWANCIWDDSMRTKNVERVLHAWGRNNLPEAQQFVSQSTQLSAEEKAKVLESLRTGKGDDDQPE